MMAPVSLHAGRWMAALRAMLPRGPDIRQAVRLLVSVLLSGVLARAVHLHEPVWSLITSVIVTQSRITQTLTTGRDQIVGTLIGAGAGVSAIILLLTTPLPTWLVFWMLLTPLALLAAARPNMRFAAITLMIVLLFPAQGGDPFLRPLDRIASIMIGVLTSLTVSFFVLHDEARRDVLRTAARLVGDIADLLDRALRGQLDHDAIEAADEACRTHIQDIYSAVAEAQVERLDVLHRRHDPLLDQLPGLLRRLRGNAVFAARAASEGETLATGAALDAERHALGRVLAQLARRCEREARTRRRRRPPTIDGAEAILVVLHEPGPDWSPVMQFTLGVLHADMARAVRAVWSDGAVSEAGEPIPLLPPAASPASSALPAPSAGHAGRAAGSHPRA
ncbi:FUSC family protein [Gluconacetobacter azotocaptans]|uniref:FUSC family protein n=2 Tax=Gluconacetobacter azotocaptans TaxID=142834 RepID=A0A7W4JUZ2_9PROT|nr:FUSC family protein [Gluconacetobacter azotocaptans]MBB2191348.1 FUSC family protein [Gluconacetobacter azotocaptans]MBM9402493.1 FUSC family protein [Gluconacetobacter azotocaptans]